MKNDFNKFDVIVIGAGPAGMMAALSATKQGRSVLLLEKNKVLGRKLLLTGNGRCNFTNISGYEEFLEHYVDSARFLHNAFSIFYNIELIKFFKKSGLKIKVEKKGRVFPVSNNAADVVLALEKQLQALKVKIELETQVNEIITSDQRVIGLLTKSNEQINSAKIIIATGGKTYPGTGSTGDGYAWAQKLGHTIVELCPGLSALVIANSWVKDLMGVSFSKAGISVYVNRKRKKTICGEIMFTHFGVSGPGVLDISLYIDKIKKQEVILKLDLLPDLADKDLKQMIDAAVLKSPGSKCRNFLTDFLPRKFSREILKITGIIEDRKMVELNKSEKNNLIKNLKSLELNVRQFFSFDQAMITRGGINTKEINPQTMESKMIKGLYFCGEVLDVAGLTGGYNLQAAFSTGVAAGSEVSQQF